MGRYKRFLYTEENIPRSSAYRRRQRSAGRRMSSEYRTIFYNSDEVLFIF